MERQQTTLLRIWCSPNRKRYTLSTLGIVDLLAILPTYIAFYIPARQQK
ncbi:MAG: hypothetical protein O7F73_17575 [Gammaproteobacteria bacterium]|nr:hypothetical protein [Gammaproteobacteria bacterium]